jgi:L-rhamnose mutarotase
LLFAYFEYVGDDLEADIAKALSNSRMQEWLRLTDPCQQPFEGDSGGSFEGNWWLNMEELFHME